MIKTQAEPALSDEDEEHVFAVVEAYQAELDAGRLPDKARYIERLPGQRQRLAELLRICDMVCTPPLALATAPAEKTAVEPRPARVGDFLLVREIGRGGMGVIYEAMQVSLERRVALKLMRHAPVENDRAKKRFSNEAHAAATLQHPNIVPVYACGFEADTPYYAMQLIEGVSVARLIQQLRRQATAGECAGGPQAGAAPCPRMPIR